MRLLPDDGHALSETYQWPVIGSHGHASRVDVPRVAYEKLADQRLGEPSEVVQARVETAREKQRIRFTGTDLACNADTRSGPADVRTFCKLDEAGNALIKAAMTQLQLSARAFSQIPEAKRKGHRVLKLVRTIADSHRTTQDQICGHKL